MCIRDRGMKKRISGLIGEFKAFAFKGNVVDMAVGVMIGGAFGMISTSLVNDIFMPLISLMLGRVNISCLLYTSRCV